MRILIAGADSSDMQDLREGLGALNCEVTSVALAVDSLRRLGAEPDYEALVVLTTVPDVAPRELVGVLRRNRASLPIVVVGPLEEHESIATLDAGADDHVSETPGPAVLLARLRAIARRGVSGPPSFVRCGTMSLDLPNRTVRRDGQLVLLTPREFSLLELLARHCDRVVPRSLLHERIWGREPGMNGRNVVDVYVSRLRRKLNRGARREHDVIRTVPGTGYMLSTEDRPAA